ncbi:MAG: biotin--[Bacteroidales bacterium]|nr:biotin--[acetyl-CoA-carboxylase] ligase [Bacteroidales bacterium]
MTKKYDIIWADKVDSTNEEARRRMKDFDNLSVLSAKEQTAGRGQRGNRWSSTAGENLTFSIILKFGAGLPSAIQLPAVPASRQAAISEAAALAVRELLYQKGIYAMIKWPNDIYVEDKKICGILIEHSLKGHFLDWSIVGIGLNVNQTQFPASLPNPTSMLAETGLEYDLPSCLEEFCEIFVSCIHLYLDSNDGYDKLRSMYLPFMWRKDEAYDYLDNVTGICFRGIIRGVSDIGLLMVENEEGEIREYGFKEISYL